MLSKLIYWKYRRGSWQYDILCALILLFIFLTPKTVFDGSIFTRTADHREELPEERVVEPDSQESKSPDSLSLPDPHKKENQGGELAVDTVHLN